MQLSLSLLIIQCLLTCLTGVVSVYQLRKEFRKRSEIDKVEAGNVKALIILLVILTVAVQTGSFVDNKSTQANLKKNFDTLKDDNISLKRKNDQLEKAIINEVDSTSATIALQASKNALQASKDITTSTDRLSATIKGTDSIPLILMPPGNNIVIGYKNMTSLPIFNLDIKCENYDSLRNCRLDYYGNKYHINRHCYEKYSQQLNFAYIYPGQITDLIFPYLSSSKDGGNLEIDGRIGNKYFIQQVTWVKYTTRIRIFGVRSMVLNDKGIYEVVNVFNPSNVKINWGVFNLPNNLIMDNN